MVCIQSVELPLAIFTVRHARRALAAGQQRSVAKPAGRTSLIAAGIAILLKRAYRRASCNCCRDEGRSKSAPSLPPMRVYAARDVCTDFHGSRDVVAAPSPRILTPGAAYSVDCGNRRYERYDCRLFRAHRAGGLRGCAGFRFRAAPDNAVPHSACHVYRTISPNALLKIFYAARRRSVGLRNRTVENDIRAGDRGGPKPSIERRISRQCAKGR